MARLSPGIKPGQGRVTRAHSPGAQGAEAMPLLPYRTCGSPRWGARNTAAITAGTARWGRRRRPAAQAIGFSMGLEAIGFSRGLTGKLRDNRLFRPSWPVRSALGRAMAVSPAHAGLPPASEVDERAVQGCRSSKVEGEGQP